jgi:5-formyltetrahydrofolate cyclo-ligase
MDVALESSKAALRLKMRSLRRELMRERPASDWQAGDHVREMLAALLPGKPTGVVGLYHASGAEMDPSPMVEILLEMGWKVALPRCTRREAPVTFYLWRPGGVLTPDAVGILSPSSDARVAVPDLVLAPVVAFDANGGRLGQGGGYYDRTMASLRKLWPRLPFVGFAHAGQEVEEVPMGEHDQRLDAILTERGYRSLK